jgi:hypothetical protein
VALCLAAVPPLAVAHQVWLTAVDLPTWDAWELAPAVADMVEGRFDPRTLWAPHNGHRPVVPRLLMLGLARVSAWDVRWEQAANLVVALGQLALVAALLQRTVAPAAPRAVPWLVAAASALIFTLEAWQNWSWGWQLQIFLNAAAACATALALAAWRGRWRQTVLVQALATTAALSFANGVALPLLVPLALLVAPVTLPYRTRFAHVAVAAVAGTALAAAYLVGFEPPPRHAQMDPELETPLNTARYALAYLGSPFASTDAAAGVIGAGGLAAVITVTLRLWRYAPEQRGALLPWALLGTYGVASALVTALGRVGFGVAQALDSRYVTISSLFWLGAAPTITLAAAHWLRTAVPTPLHTLRFGLVAGGVLGILAGGWWTGWETGAPAMQRHARRMRGARPCVRHFAEAPDRCFAHVHWNPRQLRQLAGRLAALDVGPYARWRSPPPLSTYERLPPDGTTIGLIESVSRRGTDVELRGWALDPTTRRRAHRVLVAQGDRVLGRAWTGLPRPDLADGSARAGWHLRLPAFLIDPAVPFDAWVVLDGSRRVVPLARGYPTDPLGGDA